ncbi:DUF4304 domain-containing protein [Ensifer sp. B1-9]|uniref:DUF4304 domain-containing protein n=1 Tax=Ensifer sp. B1-9 TaxID=3141455 RepID=UPI003D21BDCE
MPGSNPLVDAVAFSVKPFGFRTKARSWYLENPETILIVNLQKSQFGNQFYLNFSVVLRSISTVERPKQYHGDIRFRLEDVLASAEAELCVKLLNLENQLFSDEERQACFAELVDRALPLLLRCGTEAGAAEALSSKALPDWMLSRAGAERLHLG